MYFIIEKFQNSDLISTRSILSKKNVLQFYNFHKINMISYKTIDYDSFITQVTQKYSENSLNTGIQFDKCIDVDLGLFGKQVEQ